MLKPTKQTYDELQTAYMHFNDSLFTGALPSCLITLQRSKRTFGFFSPDRFVSREAEKCDEIAMNPAYFATRSVNEILATLVHEMVHLWQHHNGKPGRGRYHNKQWADKMQHVGLTPTDTGRDGGKMTGDAMQHVIVENGPFDTACNALLTRDFMISWLDRFSMFDSQNIKSLFDIDEDLKDRIDELGICLETETTPDKSNRCKYTHFCNDDKKVSVWGKSGLNLICGDCKKPIEAVE